MNSPAKSEDEETESSFLLWCPFIWATTSGQGLDLGCVFPLQIIWIRNFFFTGVLSILGFSWCSPVGSWDSSSQSNIWNPKGYQCAKNISFPIKMRRKHSQNYKCGTAICKSLTALQLVKGRVSKLCFKKKKRHEVGGSSERRVWGTVSGKYKKYIVACLKSQIN